jgi:uncharacterized membrane protein YfcA
MPIFIFILISFMAGFIQSATGFGSALVPMPILIRLFGIQIASPFVSLTSLTIEIILFLHFKKMVNFRVVWQMVVGLIAGIPIGVWAPRYVQERVVSSALGVIVLGYALYALLNLSLPQLQKPLWAYLAGFMSGLLGGAYNTGGPPAIIYGKCRRWEPAQFKANLQGFFIVASIWVTINQALAGNYTTSILGVFLSSFAAILLGVWAGLKISQRINPDTFHKIVHWLLILLGVQLLF